MMTKFIQDHLLCKYFLQKYLETSLNTVIFGAGELHSGEQTTITYNYMAQVQAKKINNIMKELSLYSKSFSSFISCQLEMLKLLKQFRIAMKLI